MFNIGLESFRIIDNEGWCFVVSNNIYLYITIVSIRLKVTE